MNKMITIDEIIKSKEFKKMCKITHNESLKWAKNQACKEGRQPMVTNKND